MAQRHQLNEVIHSLFPNYRNKVPTGTHEKEEASKTPNQHHARARRAWLHLHHPYQQKINAIPSHDGGRRANHQSLDCSRLVSRWAARILLS
jgi:hypothetical protein